MRNSQNLTCHLESGDSVRTSPTSGTWQQHSNRFFAEAFSRLLFGEQLCSGHIPLFDSYGAVDFYSRIAKALLQSNQPAFRATPFVLTHFKGLKQGVEWSTAERPSIFLSAFAYRVQDPDMARKVNKHFILSAMSEIDDHWPIRQELGTILEKASITGVTDELRRAVEVLGLPTQTSEHLERIWTLDDYFRSNLDFAVRPAVTVDEFKLAPVIRTALEAKPDVAELSGLFELLEKIHPAEPANRSAAYKLIEQHRQHEWDDPLCKEFIDSIYMWNQARQSGARTEITSSGIESGNADLIRVGEAVNHWVDQAKIRLDSQVLSEESLNPVLHSSKYYSGTDSLSEAAFRDALCQAFVEELCLTPEPIQDRAVAVSNLPAPKDAKSKHRQVHDFWQRRSAEINNLPRLGRLVRVRVSELNTLTCSFYWNDQLRHEIASRAGRVTVGGNESVAEMKAQLSPLSENCLRDCNELAGR